MKMNNSVFNHLVLLLLISSQYDVAVEGNISEGFADCRRFFYNGEEPAYYIGGSKEVDICQEYNNQMYFASQFDGNLKIPRYSAYVTDAGNNERAARPRKWRVELGLTPGKGVGQGTVRDNWTQDERLTQPIDDDYRNNPIYNRGHLNPMSYQMAADGKRATFTMTNALPQNMLHNSGPWGKLERKTWDLMSEKCINQNGRPYFITGGIPGKTLMNNKVRIPTHFYTAACCRMENLRGSFSFGFISRSDTRMMRKEYTASIMNVKELGEKIKQLWSIDPKPKNGIKFFSDNAVRDTDCKALSDASKTAIMQLKLSVKKDVKLVPKSDV